MNFKILSLAIVASAAMSFVSCTDPEIHSSDVPEITQSIVIVPENFHGDLYKQTSSTGNYYVNVNEKIRICSIYSIDGETISTDRAISYYNTHLWTIDSDKASASSVYYSFNKAGIHNVTFETVDFLGDTLRTQAKVYVNTPTSIALQSPANNYNQVDGDNEKGIELSWAISGIDPWETTRCTIFASYDIDSLWESPLGSVDCMQSVMLQGQLDAITTDKGDTINHSLETSTIYWSIRAVTRNENGGSEITYSDIFSFSTKLKTNGTSIIEIPVMSVNNPYPEKSKLRGVILSAAGDTLSTISENKSNTSIKKTLSPQSNIKIVICDESRTEYGCDSTTVNLAPSTKTITDTLYLQDKVKPNMTPVNMDISTTSPIKFFVFDNGSGINASKIQVILNSDTIKASYENNILSFTNTCKDECSLVITAEDYARNKTPNVRWTVKVNDSGIKILGPFAQMEGTK